MKRNIIVIMLISLIIISCNKDGIELNGRVYKYTHKGSGTTSVYLFENNNNYTKTITNSSKNITIKGIYDSKEYPCVVFMTDSASAEGNYFSTLKEIETGVFLSDKVLKVNDTMNYHLE